MIKRILFYYFAIAILVSIWRPSIFELIILIIISLIVWRLTAPIRREWDRKRWENWNRALALAKDRNFNLGRVTSLRQRARTGTKAYVKWIIGSGPSAIWIPKAWPKVGMFLLVRGCVGTGTHHNESVLFVNTLEWILPGNTQRGWKRHEKRMRDLQTENGEKGDSVLPKSAQEAPLIEFPISKIFWPPP